MPIAAGLYHHFTRLRGVRGRLRGVRGRLRGVRGLTVSASVRGLSTFDPSFSIFRHGISICLMPSLILWFKVTVSGFM